MPALPLEARTLRGWALLKKCLRGMIPSLGLIFLVLGTIFMGLATPSEAGAMGVVGAIVLAFSYGTLTLEAALSRACRRPCGSPPWSCSS